jgi:hypothetical protein
MTKRVAFSWIWGTAGLNLLIGGIVYIISSIFLQNANSLQKQVDALAWQESGSEFWSFGVMVFIAGCVTTAIVRSIEAGNSRREYSDVPTTKQAVDHVDIERVQKPETASKYSKNSQPLAPIDSLDSEPYPIVREFQNNSKTVVREQEPEYFKPAKFSVMRIFAIIIMLSVVFVFVIAMIQ